MTNWPLNTPIKTEGGRTVIVDYKRGGELCGYAPEFEGSLLRWSERTGKLLNDGDSAFTLIPPKPRVRKDELWLRWAGEVITDVSFASKSGKPNKGWVLQPITHPDDMPTREDIQKKMADAMCGDGFYCSWDSNLCKKVAAVACELFHVEH